MPSIDGRVAAGRRREAAARAAQDEAQIFHSNPIPLLARKEITIKAKRSLSQPLGRPAVDAPGAYRGAAL